MIIFGCLNTWRAHRNFYYTNCSAPDQNPGTDRETMRACLRREIEKAEVVIFLSRMFDAHATWMDFQLNAARAMKKPIIALPPFGSEGISSRAGGQGRRDSPMEPAQH